MPRGRGRPYQVHEIKDQRRPGAVWQYVRREDGQWFMRYINQSQHRGAWDESRVGPVGGQAVVFEARIVLPKSDAWEETEIEDDTSESSIGATTLIQEQN